MRFVVLFLLLASVSWAQGVEILVRATVNDDNEIGDIADVKEIPANWGGAEGPPLFIRVAIMDATTTQVQNYLDPYIRNLDYTVLTHQISTDGYRVRIENPFNNASNAYQFTKAEAIDYLSGWSFAQVNGNVNDRRFDFGIYNASITRNFWGRDVSLVGFAEFDYDEVSGIHTIDADYDAAGWNPARVAQRVIDMGGVVLSNNAGIIRYTLSRNDVIRAIKSDVSDKFRSQVKPRQRYLSPAYVTDVLNNDGGTTTTTKADILPFVLDKIDD